MGLFEMFVWSATAPRRKSRNGVWAQAKREVNRRDAEKRYVKSRVRKMELDAQAKATFEKRQPKAPVPGAAPESRYSNPEFWANRAEPTPFKKWWHAVERY